MLFRFLFFILLLVSSSYAASIKSITGNIILDSNNDGISEAKLSSSGLAIGANLSPSSNLHLQGDGVVTGNLVVGEASGNSTLEIQDSVGNSLQTISSNGSTNGYTAELIIYEDVSDDNRLKLEGYLAHKWGLESNLPSGHEYEDSPP